MTGFCYKNVNFTNGRDQARLPGEILNITALGKFQIIEKNNMEAYNCHHLNISFREKFRENNGGFHENRKIL